MSDMYSEAIHEWFCEQFPRLFTEAYLNYDQTVTLVVEINMKILYREETVKMMCWFTYGGAMPTEFEVLYADPQMFDKLERAIYAFRDMELESIKTLGCCHTGGGALPWVSWAANQTLVMEQQCSQRQQADQAMR